MKKQTIAHFLESEVRLPPAIASGAKIARIPPLVPCQIRVEKIMAFGISQTP